MKNKYKGWEDFEILGRVYAMMILEILSGKPKRYKTIKRMCVVDDGTLSRRITELQNANFIKATLIRFKHKNIVHYKLTEKGNLFVSNLIRLRGMVVG